MQLVQLGEGLFTLILTTPPMAAVFFQGFSAYIGMVGHFAAGVAEKPGDAGAVQSYPCSMDANVG